MSPIGSGIEKNMSRSSKSLFPALILITVVTGRISCAQAVGLSDAKSVDAYNPTYRYTLKKSRDPVVCKHMLQVFNDKFAKPWGTPPLLPTKNDGSYSAGGKYAFPALPGVIQNADAIYELRYSAQPTSLEFSAIPWKEGAMIMGGCSASKCPSANVPVPILIAHFDIDNDGSIDTVIKDSFFEGYTLKNESEEFLFVWRGQNFTVKNLDELSKLLKPADYKLAPILSTGLYLRPFVYAGHTFVAQYDYNDSNNSANAQGVVPWFTTPKTQDMLINQYSFTGQKQEFTGRPEWTINTICDFEMKPSNETGVRVKF